MYQAYNKIFWGIFVITFHVNFGVIRIFPTFIGFMIISSGIRTLYENTQIKSLNTARIIGNAMVVLSILGEITVLAFPDLGSLYMFNGIRVVLYTTIEILMFFKLFEGSIEYLNSSENKEDLAEGNIKYLKKYLITSTINVIILNFGVILNIGALETIAVLLMIILRISLMAKNREIRSTFAV